MLPHRLLAWTDSQIETLHPGSFALVMATGIISNAALITDLRALSDVLFFANAVAYAWLVIWTTMRAVRFPRALGSDLINPRLVFSSFTFVAGTDVLGEGVYLRGFAATALDLWLLALLAWLLLIYFSFAVMTFLNRSGGANIVHGGWLLAIVGTESLVILGAVIAPLTKDLSPAVVVFIHMLWGVGLALYAIYIALFTHRAFFFDIEPDDMTPVLWVIMGAAAISTNAGSNLILAGSNLRFLQRMSPFIDGVTLILWAWATFWLPLLVLFGIWKHGIRRIPLAYTPLLWSIVFPLGMYSAATLRLSLASDFSTLRTLSSAMLWIAVAAWAATSAALAVASWRSFRDFAGMVSMPGA